jgi:chemotaxis protein CheX
VTKKDKALDVKLINPFINATLKVLETMAFIKPEVGKPYLKKDDSTQGDVSGVIGFTGESNGTVSVTFNKLCILKIVSNMFGEEMKEINDEISDAVGELTNMISGQARKELEELGKVFHGAIPSVITGKNHKIRPIAKGQKIAIPFRTDSGSFIIEVALEGNFRAP